MTMEDLGKYKPYPAYKDSGVEWLVKIPEGWSIKKVRHLFEIKKRIAGTEGYEVLSITQQGIKIKDIKSGDGQLSMDYSKYQFVEIGDFAMNHMDLLTGYVDIASIFGVTSPDYRVFSVIDKKISFDRYYMYIFQMCYKQKIFYSFGQGASQLGRWRFPTDQFNGFKLPYPTIYEQERIAAFLDHETVKIDKLIAKQGRLIDVLYEKVTSLVLLSVDQTETQELRLENAARIISRPVSQKEGDIYTKIGLYNRGRGLFHKDPLEIDDMGDSDFFWIEEDDLIISGQFAWEGAVALAGKEDAECVVSHRYPVLRGRAGICLTEYLFALLLTKHGDFLLNENSRGAAGRNRPLNINSLLKEKIPVPDMETQEKIAKAVHLRRILSKKISKQVDLLKEHRSSLISAAVTGKIDVRNLVKHPNPQEESYACNPPNP